MQNKTDSAVRAPDQMRPVTMERNVAPYAEGSCLITFGNTKVLCAASVEETVPGWRKGTGLGWMTAEYAMLPRATRTRTTRERAQLGGRTQEIQRLIGRSIRAMLTDFAFGEYTLRLDCDVMQADGGTRTAAVTGACVAVVDAFDWMVRNGKLKETPVKQRVAAVSVGIVGGVPRIDLDYDQDSSADVDMNIVMSSEGQFVEVQGTGENNTFTTDELHRLLSLGVAGIKYLDSLQQQVLKGTTPVSSK